MGDIEVVRLQPHHAAIIPYIREADRIEAAKLYDIPIELVACYTIATAEVGWAFIYKGRPHVICGVGHDNDPWLLATDEVARHPVAFYRESGKIIDEMKERYDHLSNYVDADNKLSLRWLTWAGFTIDEAVRRGRGLFHKFHWEREVSEDVHGNSNRLVGSQLDNAGGGGSEGGKGAGGDIRE